MLSTGEVEKLYRRWSGTVGEQGWKTSLMQHFLVGGMLRAQATQFIVDCAPKDRAPEARPSVYLDPPVLTPAPADDPFGEG